MKGNLVTTGIFLAAVCASSIGLSVLAQAPAPAPVAQIGPGKTGSIGSAPAAGGTAANPTKKMLADALSPQTRQTLQEAMESVDASTLTASPTALSIGPGEAAEMDGTQVNRVAYASLPGPLRDALAGDSRRALGDGAGR